MPTDGDFRYDLRRAMQPALRPACALAAGIAAGSAWRLPVSIWLTLAVASLALAAAARGRRGAYALLFLAVALLGAARETVTLTAREGRPLARLVDAGALAAGSAVIVEGTIDAPPSRPPGLARLRVAATRVAAVEGGRETAGRVAVSVSFRTPAEEAAFDALGLGYGDGVRVLCAVDDDLAFGNPGTETLRTRLRREGIDLACRGKVEGVAPSRVGAGCPALSWLYDARERGLSAIDAAFSVRSAGLLRALLLGDGTRLDRDTADAFRRTGLFHILVVSGAHVTLVAAVLLWPARRLTRSSLLRLVAGAGPVWAYTLALGSPAPCARAAIALTVALAAPLVPRPAPPANTVSVVALVVLVWDPEALFDPGFQLTFAAVAALVLVAAPLNERFAGVGRWYPRRGTPYPPRCAPAVRALAETLFWSPRRFAKRQASAPVRFALEKARAAALLERLRIQRPARYAAQALLATLVVQVALAPLSAAHFRRVSPVALAATVPVEMALGLAMVGGFAYLLLAATSPTAAALLVPPLELLARTARTIAIAAASASWGSARVPAPVGVRAALPWLAVVAGVALAVAASRWRPVARPPRERTPRPGALLIATLVATLLLNAAAVRAPDRPAADGLLRVVFLDVGQGDAALVRFPTGETMLVDAGGRTRPAPLLGFEDGEPVYGEAFDVGERVVCEALWAMGIGRLDFAAASHGDLDHVGGFDAVASNFPIGRAFVPRGMAGAGARLRARFEEVGVPVAELVAGDRFEVGEARVEAVWPEPDAAGGDNDRSLVLRLVYGRRAILLAGDVEARAERAAVASGRDVAADVLKAPHHGSRTSSTSAFLDAVGARAVVVSAPRLSPYGHPHEEVCTRLRLHGADIYQTGVHGAVEVVTDGERLGVGGRGRSLGDRFDRRAQPNDSTDPRPPIPDP